MTAAAVTGLTEAEKQAALLPRRSSTPLQFALSLADARLLDAPTEVIRTVLDPARAPAVLLPWLALQHRVKHTWDSAAPEWRQRQIIAAQYGILQHAGTPAGLAAALEQLGVGVDYDEWFEYGGLPYHIRLYCSVAGAAPWSKAVDARVWATAVEYKRRSVAIGEFVLVRTMPENGPAVGGAQLIAETTAYVLLTPDVTPPAVVPALGAAQVIAEVIGFPLQVPDVAPPAAVAARGACLLVADEIVFARAA